MNVVSMGEVLWDVAGAQELLGGAPLNFATHLGRLGHRVSLVSAVGDDERGRRILQRLKATGISASFIRVDSAHPTGWVDVRFTPEGEPEYEIHRPVAYDFPALSPEQWRELLSAPVDWIYFGTLQQMSPAAARTDRSRDRRRAGAQSVFMMRTCACVPIAPRWFEVSSYARRWSS